MVHKKFAGATVALILAPGCGIAVQRDLSKVQTQLVIFDDMCGLQDYFDAVGSNKAAPPSIVSASDFQKEDANRPAGGKTTFAFETDFQLKHLRRLFTENWKRVPEEIMAAPRLEIEVRWAEKAGIKRAVTEEPAEITLNRKTYELPYQECLSDFLFGEPLFATRRELLGLPPVSGGSAVGATDAHPETQSLFVNKTPAPAGAAPAAAPAPAPADPAAPATPVAPKP